MRSMVLVGFSSLMFLACGKDDPIAPTASIISPEEGARHYADQKILFEGLITDDAQSPNELTVLWKSDIDGALDWANEPDSKGRISGHGYLTEGEHSVSLTATDLDDLIGRDSLLLSIGPANSAPSCAITAPPEGTATNEGDTVTLIAEVDDIDIGPVDLSIKWSSDLAGDLGTSTASLEGLASLETTALALGTHTITLTVADEMGLECQAQVVHKIGQVPRLSWVWPDADAILSAENPGYAHVSVDDDFHSPEDLVVLWESSIDGSLTPDPIDAFGNSVRDLGDLSLGTHVLTATATNPDDLTGTASLTFTINGVPDAPSVVIAPDPATSPDDLVAVVNAGTDPEGDSQTFLYQWSKDGVLDSSITGDVVPNPMTAKNQEWTVRVTPNDGYGNGPLGEASIVVSNSLPVVSVVSVSPTNPTVNDSLVCSYGFSDDDSDSDASTIKWTVGSTIVGTGASLAAGSAAKGDTVVCTVTANDGEEDGNSEMDSVTVLNSAPVVSAVSITPSTGMTTSSKLTCSGTATDADGETPTLSYTWTNGSTTIGSVSTLSLTNTISSPTDTITCTVTATDSSSATATDSASVSVENTLPEIASVSISPSDPTVTDTVSCTATTSDPDGDTPTIDYEWTTSNSTIGSGSSLDLSTTSQLKGDTLSCEVTVTDDQGDTATDSASVTIANSVPSVSGVSISPASPLVTDGLSCSYTFADDDSDTDASNVTWTVGSNTVGTGTTLAAGAVSKNETVTCTVTPSDGTDTGTAGSDAVTVVNTAPVVSAVAIDQSSPTVSDELTCSYTFVDDDSDTDASGVTWTVGSTTVGTGTTLAAGSAIKGDTVVCSVEADDGEDTGNTDTASTTIQNSAPTTPVVSINPSAPVALTDDLVCSIDTASTDADNDTITTTFMWEVDGVSWTGSTSTTTAADDTIAAADLTYDEEWTCIVTPDDGTISGTAGEDSVTVVCQDADGDGYAADSCGGTDCDDTDSSLTPEDADGDGYSTCDGDCDDADANGTLITNDADCDGVKTADDCDDSDATIYPYAGDTYNDGIDSDCDNMDCEAGYSTTGVYYAACGPQYSAWSTMEATCQAAGYDGLASIRDATENSDLRSIAAKMTSLWGVGIGGTDADEEGTWGWFDGAEWSYENFGTSMYGGSTNENCFEMYIGNGEWNDCTCGAAGSSTGMVCQYRDTCDKDGDGYDSDSSECGGLDCDDSNYLAYDSNGGSSSCVSTTCKTILDDGHSTGDGVYWVDPDGSGAFKAYCDMTQDDGGWTLIGYGINGASFPDWLTDSAMNPSYFGDSAPNVSWHYSTIQVQSLVSGGEYRGGCGLATAVPAYYWTGAGAWSWIQHVPTSTANSSYAGTGTSYGTTWSSSSHWGVVAVGAFTASHKAGSSVTSPWYCGGTHSTDINIWVR